MFVIRVSEWKSINQERVPNLLVRIILVGAVVTNKAAEFLVANTQRFVTCSWSKFNPGQVVLLQFVDLPTTT